MGNKKRKIADIPLDTERKRKYFAAFESMNEVGKSNNWTVSPALKKSGYLYIELSCDVQDDHKDSEKKVMVNQRRTVLVPANISLWNLVRVWGIVFDHPVDQDLMDWTFTSNKIMPICTVNNGPDLEELAKSIWFRSIKAIKSPKSFGKSRLKS